MIDVAVVGGGPAGLAAATRAAEAGAGVLLFDDGLHPGGQIWRHQVRDTLPRVARRWLTRFGRAEAWAVTEAAVVDIVASVPGHDSFLIQTAWGPSPLPIRARAVVLATGARELFLPFPGWTLPNVLGVGGAQALVKGGMSVVGKRVIVAGSGPLLLAVAAALSRHGAEVRVVAEQAPTERVMRFARSLWRTPEKLVQSAALRLALTGARHRMGAWVIEAMGSERVEAAVLTDGDRRWVEPCDVLCIGYGLVPNLELATLAGCEVVDGAVQVDDRQETSVAGIYCAGEATGVGGAELAVAEGEIAGLAATGQRYFPAELRSRRARLRSFAQRLGETFALRDELRRLARPDTVVCRCEDVTAGELNPTWSPRQAKLLTRAGMGPCQGRVCGAALSVLYGWPPDTIRPPAAAVPVGALLGPTP